jgi:hypothetical protein
LQTLIDRGTLAGRAYWLSGPSGAGKTTIARLIVKEVAEPSFIQEVNAAALSVPALRGIEAEWLGTEQPLQPFKVGDLATRAKPKSIGVDFDPDVPAKGSVVPRLGTTLDFVDSGDPSRRGQLFPS